MNRKLRNRLLSISVVALALGAVSPAYAYSVYRSVTANAATGVVVWTRDNFGVSGNPPTLSFFYFDNDDDARAGLPAAQCFVKVDLPDDAPAPGDEANVGNADIKFYIDDIFKPKPFPWVITFDNDPPGHWSIARSQITDATTNAAASRVAAAGFQSLATTANSGVTVINGTLENCTAQ
ncbi:MULTISPECIES: hypothetical protein [unclassified Rhizobium]|uniref:hypothetical protein n=1 Tax=unclassified Rhizobium TaxID=2613769 RepID=UPI001780087A|nr:MULTISPECIES: hypothetical protein [unclassified Rhizobium]MBD8687012.1 hypothetical protein [Rhizobium sp. CFBP 13644]MBD8691185.1 hypothetical protein [Rhizobium sp. CFBP 13717]